MSELDARTVGERLGLPERTIERLGGLAGHDVRRLDLPDDAEARRRLAFLGAPSEFVPGILAARPDPLAQQEVWWILELAFGDVVGNLGVADRFGGWPPMPVSGDKFVRHVYIWVCLAALPHTLRFHKTRGIPDDLSEHMLSGMLKVVAESKAAFGVDGLLFGLWTPPLVLRGVTYELGRLAYDFGQSINMHIPNKQRKGGLDPAACDESIALAREFAARHFPEHPEPGLCCHSWLLDPQLAEYLAEDSNLIRFQRRFRLDELAEGKDRADHEIIHYVFGQNPPDSEDIPEQLLAELPQDTSLRRAYVAHLRKGEHWYSRTGWLLTGRGGVDGMAEH